MNPTQMSRIQSNRPVREKLACEQALPGALAAKQEKGGELVTTSLEFEYLHRKSRCEMLVTLAMCCSKFFLHSRSILLHTDWRKSDSSVDGEPQGNWRWNSHSRDIVASSRFFSRPTTRAPRRACSQARKKLKMSFNLEEFWSAI